jgi:AraC-like DNA-binding protein
VPGADHYRHRDDLLPEAPGVVAAACAYQSSGLPEGDHRGLPSPWVTFIVSVDRPVRVCGTVQEGGGFDPARATSYDVCVAGLHPVATRVEQPSEQAGVQLSLHPLAVPALLGCRAAELVGQGDHGHEVLGAAARELHERVGSAAQAADRLDVVQQWLRDRVDHRRWSEMRPELVRAWELLQASGGRHRVEDLARDVQLSPRQLRALMVAETGASPKQLAREFRFDAAVGLLADGSRTLAEIAAETGYADQAHLTREFRQMAGCSPSQWLAEERRNIQDGGHRKRPSWAHERTDQH